MVRFNSSITLKHGMEKLEPAHNSYNSFTCL